MFVMTKKLFKWKGLPAAVLYCRYIGVGSNISGTQHDIMVKGSCVMGMIIGEDFISGQVFH